MHLTDGHSLPDLNALKPNLVHTWILRFALPTLLLFCIGCHSPSVAPRKQDVSSQSSPAAAFDAMHALVQEQLVSNVLRNIDRPFEATLDNCFILIDQDDPLLAQCVLTTEESREKRQEKVTFFLTFENSAYPEFSSRQSDLHCILINRDGSVLFRDEEAWSDFSREVLEQAGAVDSLGPPEVALKILRLIKLRKNAETIQGKQTRGIEHESLQDPSPLFKSGARYGDSLVLELSKCLNLPRRRTGNTMLNVFNVPLRHFESHVASDSTLTGRIAYNNLSPGSPSTPTDSVLIQSQPLKRINEPCEESIRGAVKFANNSNAKTVAIVNVPLD